MGPVFDNEEYPRKIFNYIKSWNDIKDEDPELFLILLISSNFFCLISVNNPFDLR